MIYVCTSAENILILCKMYAYELFIQLRIYHISHVQGMQFTSSYNKVCSNVHDVIYHYF